MFLETEIRALASRAQVAPVISEARTVDRFHRAGQERLVVAGAQFMVELGQRLDQFVSRSRPSRWRHLNHNPISLLNECR